MSHARSCDSGAIWLRRLMRSATRCPTRRMPQPNEIGVARRQRRNADHTPALAADCHAVKPPRSSGAWPPRRTDGFMSPFSRRKLYGDEIVAHTFFAKLSLQPATRTSVPPTELCGPNKIYKINSVPARLTATGRLLEYSAFAIFLDTATPAERTLCRVTISRMSSRIYRLSKLY